MEPELTRTPSKRGIPPEELQALWDAVQRAVTLARGGSSALGYQLLRWGRERAVTDGALELDWGPELLRRWNAALRWYERSAPPPW